MRADYIRAWGLLMGCKASEIKRRQKQAVKQKAPRDALFEMPGGRHDDQPTGEWKRFRDLPPLRQEQVRALARRRRIKVR